MWVKGATLTVVRGVDRPNFTLATLAVLRAPWVWLGARRRAAKVLAELNLNAISWPHD
jgi:hypothetical protein